jgi:hypothetical protein
MPKAHAAARKHTPAEVPCPVTTEEMPPMSAESPVIKHPNIAIPGTAEDFERVWVRFLSVVDIEKGVPHPLQKSDVIPLALHSRNMLLFRVGSLATFRSQVANYTRRMGASFSQLDWYIDSTKSKPPRLQG